MVYFTFKVDAKGTLTPDMEELATTKCSVDITATKEIDAETLSFIKIAILEKVLSNELGIDIKEVLDQHIAIQDLTK